VDEWREAWELAKPVLEPSLAIVGGLLAGYVGAVLRFRRTVTQHRKAVERLVRIQGAALRKEFDDLRHVLGKGLQLEVANLRGQVDAELRRLENVERDVRDVREKSGDYTSDAQFSELEQRVSRWMVETSRVLGRVTQALKIVEEAETRRSRPPRE
jgi:predicted  nucleic acid-binding Zn-ribbon protein